MGSEYVLSVPSIDDDEHVQRRQIRGAGSNILSGLESSLLSSTVVPNSTGGEMDGETLPVVQKVRAVDAASKVGGALKENTMGLVSTSSSREHSSTGTIHVCCMHRMFLCIAGSVTQLEY